MATHELKSWPDYFEPILTGSKAFELRLNDRDFRVGDTLKLREYDDRKAVYTGREIKKKVTFLLDGIGGGCIPPHRGLNRGYVIMSLVDE